MREPIARCNILVPQDYLGNVITLCVEKRGVQHDMQFLGAQVSVVYDIPMAEVVLDFFDRLKSVSRGYASLDYGFERFQAAPLARVDVLINGERVDALAVIVHRDQVQSRGQGAHREDEGADSEADVRRRHPGGCRWKNCSETNRQGLEEECDRQVLRRGREPQAEVAGQAKGR